MTSYTQVVVTGLDTTKTVVHERVKRESCARDDSEELVTLTFSLSAAPPPKWAVGFVERCKDELSRRSPQIERNVVLLTLPTDRLRHLAVDVDSLKRAVEAANNDYGRHLSAQAAEASRQKKIKAEVQAAADVLHFD